MKWILLPICTTIFDVIVFVLILNHGHTRLSSAQAELIPASQESLSTTVLDSTSSSEKLCSPLSQDKQDFAGDGICAKREPSLLFNNTHHSNGVLKARDVNEEESDPTMLSMMSSKDADFVAYVRPDISKFYGKNLGDLQEVTPAFRGHASKFINISPDALALYWDSGRVGDPGRFIGYANPFASAGTATFPSHRFYFTPHHDPSDIICRFKVTKGTSVYFCNPYEDDLSEIKSEPGRGLVAKEHRRSLNTLDQKQQEMFAKSKYNIEFGKLYKNFTGGSDWLSTYPRSRPLFKFWNAEHFGQQHQVQSYETHFVQMPPSRRLPKLKDAELQQRRKEDPSMIALKEYRTQHNGSYLNLTLAAISCAPRAFEIQHFLSDVEIEHILDIGEKKHLRQSTTGTFEGKEASTDMDTRSSRNTWVGRNSSPIIDAIYRRAADVLRIDESLLRRRGHDEPQLRAGTEASISEDLQLVHYDVGQQYTAHHDFGFPDGRHPDSPSRAINILLYLNEGMEGGETSFPRWRNAETSQGLDIKPEKGKAVIFYMLLPDGNMDDLSQHAALPVRVGEKWLANLWVHDPFLR